MNQGVKSAIQNSLRSDPPRPSWDEIWMDVAHSIAQRSCDEKYKVGVVIVSCDNTQVLSVGYNGNFKNGPNVRDSMETGKGGLIHAETNALIKCDFNFPKKKVLYTTLSPCRSCSKQIINAEISRVVYDELYKPDTSGLDLMLSCGIEIVTTSEEYSKRHRYLCHDNIENAD